MRPILVLAFVIAAAAPVAPVAADPAVEISLGDAGRLLGASARSSATACPDVPCLIERAYARDRKAKATALALHQTGGHVAGVGSAEVMDGGYRGKIRLVPQLPIGSYRRHLDRTAAALATFEAFFTALFHGSSSQPTYRWRALSLKYVRSIGKRTPSAYATGWAITYNVAGSLLTTEAGVTETLWHELFHLNDFAHGGWSAATLQRDYDAIVARCGTKAACLAPYAPNTTKVRATGTYYAFQPDNGNGVHEYAAELAVRYFREQRQMLRDGKLARPAFKCGPAENARSWTALIAEFFAGRDLVPACPP